MGRRRVKKDDEDLDPEQEDNNADDQQQQEEEEEEEEEGVMHEEEEEAGDDDADATADFDEKLVCTGQTDAERRQIRVSQRQLRHTIGDIDVEAAREKNNRLNRQVRYIREAVLDSENLDVIAQKAAAKVEAIVKVPRYDADRVISKLIEKCQVRKNGSSFFDWHGLGIQAGLCFNAAPSNVSFLNGPLLDGNEEIHAKKRAKYTRQKMSEEEANEKEERPDDIKGHTKRSADTLSAVEQNIADVREAMSHKVDKTYIANKKKLTRKYGSKDDIPTKIAKKLKKNTSACAIELLFNPKSFTQTVENLFHYSFLVKQGTTAFSVREKKIIDAGVVEIAGGPVVKRINTPEEGNAQAAPPARQAIVSLNMRDWRKLIEAYGIQESDVPHREGSIYEKRTATK